MHSTSGSTWAKGCETITAFHNSGIPTFPSACRRLGAVSDGLRLCLGAGSKGRPSLSRVNGQVRSNPKRASLSLIWRPGGSCFHHFFAVLFGSSQQMDRDGEGSNDDDGGDDESTCRQQKAISRAGRIKSDARICTVEKPVSPLFVYLLCPMYSAPPPRGQLAADRERSFVRNPQPLH